MDIHKAKDHYIFQTKIELDGDDYIVLREPTTAMLRPLQSSAAVEDETTASQKMLDMLTKHFGDCLVEHSFTDGDNPAKTEDVVELLKASSSRFTDILVTWGTSLPLLKKKDET
jgi:hypothetical protein